ncbi:MAG: dTMP kinase [Tepidisphaera sp.]|nr:dTMP kinase [Tepidisphaera sp.]
MADAASQSAPPWLAKLAGRFLVFEGPDGSGKSTQMKRLVALLAAHGVPVCEVREPGGTDVGERIRQILLDKNQSEMALRCEMLLYMASRAQLVEKRIAPALGAGHVVIADRFVSSTIAYQGAAGGLPREEIDAVTGVACGALRPDLILIFDVDEETAAKRAGIIGPTGKGKRADASSGSLFADRMEDRSREFRRKVRESYLAQAKEEPSRHALINASKGPEEVWASLARVLEKWFG